MAAVTKQEVINAIALVGKALEQVSDPKKRVSGEVALSALRPIFEDPGLIPNQKRRRTRQNKEWQEEGTHLAPAIFTLQNLLESLLASRMLKHSAMLPESLVRSCSIILGPEAAENLKLQMKARNFRVPHESTMSRFRLKLDDRISMDGAATLYQQEFSPGAFSASQLLRTTALPAALIGAGIFRVA